MTNEESYRRKAEEHLSSFKKFKRLADEEATKPKTKAYKVTICDASGVELASGNCRFTTTKADWFWQKLGFEELPQSSAGGILPVVETGCARYYLLEDKDGRVLPSLIPIDPSQWSHTYLTFGAEVDLLPIEVSYGMGL